MLNKKFLLQYVIFFVLFLSFCLQIQSQSSQIVSKNNLNQNYVPFPKILWAYWSSQKQMGELQHNFYVRIQRFMKIGVNIQWQFILITDSNLKKYLSNYDECQRVINNVKKITPANKADIVRLFILQQHGGVYFDLTTAFVEDLSWMQLSNMLNNPLIVNKHKIYSPQPDVLMFYGIFHQYRNQYHDQYNTLRNDFPGFQTWFIGSKKNALFIKDWKNKLIQYYSASAVYIFENMRYHDIFFSNFYLETYHNVYLALYFVLQNKQKQLDLQTILLKDRKNVNLHYKIWAIDCDCGPCTIYGQQIRQGSYPKFFFTKSQNQLAQIFGQNQIKYFIKFTHYHLNGFRNILQKMTQPDIFNQSLIKYYELSLNQRKKQQRKVQVQSCKNFTQFLNKDSFTFKYIFSDFWDSSSILNNKIRAFNQSQIKQFYDYCQKKNPYQNIYDQIIDTFLSLHLTMYIPKIVLIGFYIIGFLILTISILFCQTQYQNLYQKKRNFREITTNNSISIGYYNQNQYIGFYTQIALFIDKIFKQYLKIQIHYYVLNLILVAFLIYKFYINQILSFREEFNSTFFIFIFQRLMLKLMKYHSKTSYVPNVFLSFFPTLCNICMIKIILQLVFNEPTYFYFGTIWVGVFGLTVIQNVQKDQSIFRQINLLENIRKKLNSFHQNILTIILALLAFIPNLKYYMIYGQYLTLRIYQIFIFYIIILVILTIILECKNYHCQVRNKRQFYCTNRIISSYWLALTFTIFYDSYWNYLYIAQLMMIRRTFLLGAICLYSSTKSKYNRSIIKTNIYSFFSITLGCLMIGLTYFFDKIKENIQNNSQILFIKLLDNLSTIFFALTLIKILFSICHEMKNQKIIYFMKIKDKIDQNENCNSFCKVFQQKKKNQHLINN